MRSLTTRLVVTAVMLVALVTLLIGAATALAMRAYLTDRLDDDLQASVERTRLDYLLDPGGPGPRSGPDGPAGGEGQAIGTVSAFVADDYRDARVLTEDRGDRPEWVDLDAEVADTLAAVPDDRDAHEVTLDGLGDYRVLRDDEVIAGLPTEDVSDTVGSLVRLELLLGLAGVAAAAAAGLVVVRRQLAPLREVAGTAHEVAELPLGSGDVDVDVRVPDRLTDERTEVGQVGAALNTLLDHVETSLATRHRSEQQVRQFVADASHELRTPLATIRGYAELARRHPDDPAGVRTALGKVEVESSRMAALVEDLLLLARLDAGRSLERSPVDLTRLLLEAVDDARVLAPDHRWRVALPDEPVEVVGDEQRLHQVVTNLLTNARKYTPAGTTVTVTATAAGFSVHDDGPGFDADLQARAFERFTRGDEARTREAGSSAGLGLALVRAIVEAHGGTVTLSSRPGDTTVLVDLPG